MDKIAKALKRLSGKEKSRIKQTLQKLFSGNNKSLDIKKLKGQKDIFRVRQGDLRIIYQRQTDGSIFILAIERRSDKTYWESCICQNPIFLVYYR